MENLIGKRFGKLTVIEFSRQNDKRRKWWKCKCDCGNEKEMEQWYLTTRSKSCGCIRAHRDDLTNKRFGKLTVIEFGYWKKLSGTYWKCKCECGNECLVRSSNLKTGWTNSCGCERNKCGRQRTSFKGYEGISGTTFAAIKSNAYHRSIEFDLSIEYLWTLFTEQKGKCMLSGEDICFSKNSKTHDKTASLDRIDSDKGYVKGNVQWVHKDINFMKQSLSQDCFIKMCRKVVNHYDEQVKN